MKKIFIILLSFISTYYSHAQTPIFQFDLKSESDYPIKINEGYAFPYFLKANVISGGLCKKKLAALWGISIPEIIRFLL